MKSETKVVVGDMFEGHLGTLRIFHGGGYCGAGCFLENSRGGVGNILFANRRHNFFFFISSLFLYIVC